MSELKNYRSAEDASGKIIQLLTEYTTKLKQFQQARLRLANSTPTGIRTHDSEILSQIARTSDRERFDRQQRGMFELSRHASQMLEHGDVDPITRLELKLRLGEFEAELHAAERLVYS